jgi:hypothetical protein
MSPEAYQDYLHDLNDFYIGFTGKPKPDYITQYRDITYQHVCSIKSDKDNVVAEEDNNDDNDDDNDNYDDDNDDNKQRHVSMFEQYGIHLRNMIQEICKEVIPLSKLQEQLLIHIRKEHKEQREQKEQKQEINPSLTYPELKSMAEQIRMHIANMYLIIERDGKEGIELFERLLQTQLLKTAKRQLINLSLLYQDQDQDQENI